eukprot:1154910-Pyramimonas_sp.AAC.1
MSWRCRPSADRSWSGMGIWPGGRIHGSDNLGCRLPFLVTFLTGTGIRAWGWITGELAETDSRVTKSG